MAPIRKTMKLSKQVLGLGLTAICGVFVANSVALAEMPTDVIEAQIVAAASRPEISVEDALFLKEVTDTADEMNASLLFFAMIGDFATETSVVPEADFYEKYERYRGLLIKAGYAPAAVSGVSIAAGVAGAGGGIANVMSRNVRSLSLSAGAGQMAFNLGGFLAAAVFNNMITKPILSLGHTIGFVPTSVVVAGFTASLAASGSALVLDATDAKAVQAFVESAVTGDSVVAKEIRDHVGRFGEMVSLTADQKKLVATRMEEKFYELILSSSWKLKPTDYKVDTLKVMLEVGVISEQVYEKIAGAQEEIALVAKAMEESGLTGPDAATIAMKKLSLMAYLEVVIEGKLKDGAFDYDPAIKASVTKLLAQVRSRVAFLEFVAEQ